MSSSSTEYTVNGTDLINIFAPYTSGTKAIVTGYKVKGVDLNEIFAPISSSPFSITCDNYSIQYLSDSILIYFNTTGSIVFNTSIQSVNYIAVGAGGIGASDSGGGGGGGGGGEYLTGSFTSNAGDKYTITVSPDFNSSNLSSISLNSTNIATAENGLGTITTNGATSGSGNAGGKSETINTRIYGGGGGGAYSAGTTSIGGAGYTFNGIIYGMGGNGGDNAQTIPSVNGKPNTGTGGAGSNDYTVDGEYVGGMGGSGVVILYFNT